MLVIGVVVVPDVRDICWVQAWWCVLRGVLCVLCEFWKNVFPLVNGCGCESVLCHCVSCPFKLHADSVMCLLCIYVHLCL